jgi:hypothetical protein
MRKPPLSPTYPLPQHAFACRRYRQGRAFAVSGCLGTGGSETAAGDDTLEIWRRRWDCAGGSAGYSQSGAATIKATVPSDRSASRRSIIGEQRAGPDVVSAWLKKKRPGGRSAAVCQCSSSVRAKRPVRRQHQERTRSAQRSSDAATRAGLSPSAARLASALHGWPAFVPPCGRRMPLRTLGRAAHTRC